MHESRNKLLEHLYDQYYDSVFRLCLSIVSYNQQYSPLIEDCIQDAFVKALTHYEEFKDYANPMGWVALTTTNRLKNELRKVQKHNRVSFSLTPDELESLAFSYEEEEHFINKIEASEQIARLYDMLTERERVVFKEYFVEGKRLREVVDDTGLSMDAVRSGVSRIRKRARSKKFFSIFFILRGFF